MKYRAAVFDLDGTLVNSLEDIVNAFNAVLQIMGYPMLEKQKIKEEIGEPLRVRVMHALPEGNKDETLFRLFRDHYKCELEKRCIENTSPYEGIREMLLELKRRNIISGILTNKREEVAIKVITELIPNIEVDAVRGLRPGVPEKPNPDGAYLVAEDLDVSVKEIIYVGDTKVDMETANAAGMLPVGVAWGFQSIDMLRKHGAQIILKHPLDLIKIFD